MKTVEISTPQNVKLELQLPNVGIRIAAFAIDQVAFWLVILISSLLLEYLLGDSALATFVFYVVIFPVFLGYSALFELLWGGQTPGKRILGIRVIRLDGGRVGVNEVISRWLMRAVDILLTLGSLAMVMVSTSKLGQRVGDVLASTIVVYDSSTRTVSLSHILNLDTVDSYTPKYKSARLLSEEEALLVKKVIVRYEESKNEGHRLAILELSKKLQEVLGIVKEEKKDTDFLRALLKDYIVLTR